MVMGLFAALQDYYTWRLAERIYGSKSSETTAVVCSFELEAVKKNNPRLIFILLVVCHNLIEPVAMVRVHACIVELS